MKKYFVFVMALLLALGMAACGSETASDSTGTGSGEGSSDNVEKAEAVAWEVQDARVVTWVNSIGTTWVQLSVPVVNTGSENLYLEAASVDLEDSSGHLVDSLSLVSVYPQVIQPGETAYYYEEHSLDEGADGELNAVLHAKVEKAKVDCVRYEVSDISIVDEKYGDISMKGRVENTSDEDETFVYVSALLFDENDELIAELFTIVDELPAGDKVGFSASSFSIPNDVSADKVARYDVYAYPTQFQF